MNLTTRQDYYDVSPEQALRLQCDIVQLKYDGWWCRFVVEADGKFHMYSRTGRSLKSGQTSPNACGVYIGEYMFGTQWAQDPSRKDRLYLFDCWGRNDADTVQFTYRDRYGLLKIAKNFLPDWCHLVDNYPIAATNDLWQLYVESSQFEGVVFRSSRDTAASKVYRHKRTIADEYLVKGVEVGEGKYANTLGALICVTAGGQEAKVGGGFTDEERHRIWANPSDFIGKTIEVEGKARFEDTGLLRHPVFVRIKDSA